MKFYELDSVEDDNLDDNEDYTKILPKAANAEVERGKEDATQCWE